MGAVAPRRTRFTPAFRHTQDMAQPRPRPSRGLGLVVTILMTIAGFVVPFTILDAILSQLMPPKHDMSDLTTGVVRLTLSTVGGVVGALVTYSILRRRRRH